MRDTLSCDVCGAPVATNETWTTRAQAVVCESCYKSETEHEDRQLGAALLSAVRALGKARAVQPHNERAITDAEAKLDDLVQEIAGEAEGEEAE